MVATDDSGSFPRGRRRRRCGRCCSCSCGRPPRTRRRAPPRPPPGRGPPSWGWSRWRAARGTCGPPARRRSARPPRRRSPSMPSARSPLSRRTPLDEGVPEHRRDLGVLLGQHLLAAHDQRDLRSERREHVHELHAGDARAHHHEVLARKGRRHDESHARRSGPSRGCGGGSRWTGRSCRPRPPRSRPGAGDLDLVGPHEPARALHEAHALALQQPGHRRLQPLLDAHDPPRSAPKSARRGPARGPCPLPPGASRSWRRRWRSWPWRGCSPTGAHRPPRHARSR